MRGGRLQAAGAAFEGWVGLDPGMQTPVPQIHVRTLNVAPLTSGWMAQDFLRCRCTPEPNRPRD